MPGSAQPEFSLGQRVEGLIITAVVVGVNSLVIAAALILAIRGRARLSTARHLQVARPHIPRLPGHLLRGLPAHRGMGQIRRQPSDRHAHDTGHRAFAAAYLMRDPRVPQFVLLCRVPVPGRGGAPVAAARAGRGGRLDHGYITRLHAL